MARILIAEDDDSMRHFLARELERAGHQVSSVGDGIEAIPLLEHSEFDLLVADIVMPEMDGLELARRAEKLRHGLKIIFITGFAAVAMNARNNPMPGTTVLSKPFHLRQLVAEVDKALAGRNVEDGSTAPA